MRMLTTRTLPAAALLLVFVLPFAGGGCASHKDIVPAGLLQADRYLYERGTELLGRKKWVQAREYFRRLVDNYPQSSYRPDAKLALGDTYLGEGSAEALVLAQNEFKEFLTFYPTNPRADYAQYKLGISHYQQMLAPDRDQTETREAIAEFKLFLERYPNSSLLGEVRAKLREATNRLSESEYRVGVFYYRIRWYPGAVQRFKQLLSADPEFPRRDAVYFYMADALAKAGQKAEALPYFDRLVKEFERSEYLDRARRAAEALKAELGLNRDKKSPG